MAVRVCLLYVLFDPDMISWRERGPGWASLRMLLRLTPFSSLPPEPRPQLPSAPALQQWAASSRTGLARRALCWGQQRGQEAGGEGYIPPGCVSKDISWEPPHVQCPFWPGLLGFRWALGSHMTLISSPSSHSKRLPSAQRWEPAETC